MDTTYATYMGNELRYAETFLQLGMANGLTCWKPAETHKTFERDGLASLEHPKQASQSLRVLPIVRFSLVAQPPA